MRLYLAYGANLNKSVMRSRCPEARAVGRATLDNSRLIFRGAADVIPANGMKLVCGLWKISRDDERSLDRFEGAGSGVYEKRYVTLDGGDEAMIYVMTARGIMPPAAYYVERIRQGYRDFEIDVAQLDQAIQYSWTGKDPCPDTLRRRQRQAASGQDLYRPGKKNKQKVTRVADVKWTPAAPSPASMLMVKQRCADCASVDWVEKHLKRNLCDWCIEERNSLARKYKKR